MFAICAVACISILTAAYFYATDSRATGYAMSYAESGAEVFRATGGDFDAVSKIMSGTARNGENGSQILTVFYDSSWQIMNNSTEASFVLNLEVFDSNAVNSANLVAGHLVVSKITGEELIAFPLTARK